MIERFTVDAVAAEIINHVSGARLSPKLTHRFLRKGRWAGRRLHDFSHIEQVLRGAVDVASSQIAEAYLNERATLRRQRRELTTTAGASTGESGAKFGESEEHHAPDEHDVGDEKDTTAAAADGSPPTPPSGGGAAGRTGGGPDLSGSLDALAAARAKAEAERRAALAAAEAEKVRQEAEKRRLAAEQAEVQLAGTEEDLANLLERYQQRLASAQNAGETLWARYCDGYDIGLRKRGAPDDTVQTPEPSITFAVPAALQQDSTEGAAQPAASVPIPTNPIDEES